jgi:Tfp pilus assembly protein PilO
MSPSTPLGTGESTRGTSLVRRIAAEHRRVLLPLALALLVNVIVYVAFVYPLSQRVANIEQREDAAEQTLTAARREHEQASGALTGKARASAELATFYSDVLPQGQTGARRQTYLRLATLARDSNLRLLNWQADPVEVKDSALQQLTITLQLAGAWPDIRDFIYQLEIAPEFVVIDNVQLSEGADGGALSLGMNLSTYYNRDAAP